MKALKGTLAECSANGVSYVPTPQILAELGDDIQALNNIRQCGISQERIANDILSLSKIQLNALTILPVAFELQTEVQQILTSFGAELASKGISLSVEFGAGLNTPGFSTVFTDLGRLTQIITNLMSNAIRFTEMNARLSEIKVSLDVSADPPVDESCLVPPVATQPGAEGDEPQPIYIYMSFQDSGPGLLKEDLALLFHRQVSPKNKAKCLIDYRPKGSRKDRMITTFLVARDWTCLFAIISVTILMRQMKRAGFTAILASNGAQAVQIVTENQANSSPFDVILMDLQMPVMQVESL
ncbi:hypothetical protein FRC12_003527 [Ceratobasidium sp. 428]|nr:hypothetical protein FRC12_003527 [Ceratobasidium sp. 428]